MSFIDKVKVAITAGKGGNGKMSFRHEKYIDKGGPDGGDGGKGGDVILVASRNQNTLAAFRYQKELVAEPGQAGMASNKHGRNGKNLLVAVPVGTIATDEQGVVVADLVEDGQQVIIAAGGRGGFGNAHFVSSRRQAPNFAEKGELGFEQQYVLELKMIADVGLVGLPNAGKSTLLSVLSNARPEIADYPFTTLRPNLGVVDIDKHSSMLFADIPGLIEGAADGKGLGHDFLRHIERTATILHMIDAYQPDVAETYQIVQAELAAYQPALAKRPQIIAINKVEGLDAEIINDLIAQLRVVAGKKIPICAISAQAGIGLKELVFAVLKLVQKTTAEAAAKEAATVTSNALPVIQMTDQSLKWHVEKTDVGFHVTGAKIIQFAKRTDFDNEEGVQRLRDIMKRYGILHELTRQGIEPGQLIYFGTQSTDRFKY